jgi:hypothetical protein
MKRLGYLLAASLAATAPAALAVGRLADVEIIDRTTGTPLEAHYYRGDYWVAGRPGGRYAIAIHNRVGERLLAVTSVDGVNVISGDNAGFQQTGYVFDAFQSYEITGWRKSDRDVATFEFTPSPNSYAERTGRPANVGVIGVALFRELRPAYNVQPPMVSEPSARAEGAAPAESARAKAADAAVAQSLATPAPASPKLGTGHGARESSYVEHTDFERQSSLPNEVVRIRYDSYENLVAMGVIRAHPLPPPRPNPFPDSPGRYVPDPPGAPAIGLR